MRRIARALAAAVVLAGLGGCAAQRVEREARAFAAEGRFDRALATIERGLTAHPESVDLRRTRLALREQAAAQALMQAGADRAAGRDEKAEEGLQRLLKLDPGNDRAQGALLDIERDRRQRSAAQQASKLVAAGDWRRAQAIVELALKENARDPGLQRLQRDIELHLRGEDAITTTLRLADTRPITFEFRDANIRMIFEALSRSTGINFIIDKDLRADLRATIFLKDARIEDALNVLASSNQLVVRVLNPTTALVFPNTAEKLREYQDLLIRGFYLANADAKQTGALLKQMLKLKDVFIDEKLNLVVVRDTPDAVRLAERLVAMHDLVEPEVMLEVEVLEVNTSRLLELGIKYPDTFSLTPLNSAGGTGLTLNDLQNLNSSRIGVSVPNLLLSLKREVGDATVLANPRIRARNREKARILIGDRVPIITTTATGTGFVSENVQYVDVGIKLEVEPNVYFDDDVAIRVALEVSSLVRELRTATGSLAYQIGTRTASTTLRLRDGETQVLAGLISREDRSSASRIPGAGDLPVIGRLFGNQRDDARKTEIVLAITPRLLRAARPPDANLTEFWSGSESTLRLRPLSLPSTEDRGSTAARAPVPRAAAAAVAAPAVPAASVATETTALASAPAGLTARSAPNAETGAVTRRPPRQSTTELSAPPTVKAGEEFEVRINLKSDGGLRSMPLQVAYDPAKLQVIAVREGNYFKHGGGSTTFTQQVAPQDGRVAISVQRSGVDGVQGEGVFAVLRFKALSAGVSRVAVASANAFGVDGVDPTTVLAAPVEVEVK